MTKDEHAKYVTAWTNYCRNEEARIADQHRGMCRRLKANGAVK